jgi:hypothetical protein
MSEQSEGRESAELLAAKHELVLDILQMRKAFERESGIDTSEQGALAGMALGVKPAVWLGGRHEFKNPEAIINAFQQVGINPVAVDRLIFDPEQIKTRIGTESRLAEYTGWDVKKDPTEFIKNQELWTKIKGDWTRNLRRGFMLGYPESAIRGLGHALSMTRSREIPLKQGVYETRGRFPDEEIVKIYMNDYHLSKDEAQYLTGQRTVEIDSPVGVNVYFFQVFGKDGENASDVQALRAKVDAAFEKAGF